MRAWKPSVDTIFVRIETLKWSSQFSKRIKKSSGSDLLVVQKKSTTRVSYGVSHSDVSPMLIRPSYSDSAMVIRPSYSDSAMVIRPSYSDSAQFEWNELSQVRKGSRKLWWLGILYPHLILKSSKES